MLIANKTGATTARGDAASRCGGGRGRFSVNPLDSSER